MYLIFGVIERYGRFSAFHTVHLMVPGLMFIKAPTSLGDCPACAAPTKKPRLAGDNSRLVVLRTRLPDISESGVR